VAAVSISNEEEPAMQDIQHPGGTAGWWGPLFGAHARAWAETWEGPGGYGTQAYEHVLDRNRVRSGTRVLDCGCGAGRFAHMAADAGAVVAGIDAAEGLIAIAAQRTPDGDFRVADLEAVPWPDDSFDVVTGFNAFQFANDKVGALSEAGRLSRGVLAVVIPTRMAESGIAAVFMPLFPLYPPDVLTIMKDYGIFALSAPGQLDEVLNAADLVIDDDDEFNWPVTFDDLETAERAFIGAGPMQPAIHQSGDQTVAAAVSDALVPFTATNGQVVLPAWWRVVLTRPEDAQP
jgi:SAM-dependent methyltransferase